MTRPHSRALASFLTMPLLGPVHEVACDPTAGRVFKLVTASPDRALTPAEWAQIEAATRATGGDA